MTIGTPTILYSAAAAPSLSSTYTVTLTADAAAGSRLWYFHASEAGDTTPTVPTFTVTDSKANTWTLDRPMLRNSVTGGTVAIIGASSLLSTSLVAGDTVTLTCTSADWASTRRAVLIAASTGVMGAGALDQSTTYTGGTTASLSLGPVTTDSDGEILWQLWGAGVRAHTPGTGYTELAELATTAGSSDRELIVSYKIATTAGTETATGSLTGGTTTVVGSLLTYRAATTAPPQGSASGSITWAGRAGRDLVGELAYPAVLAHRGGAAEAPENTPTAYAQTFAALPGVIGEMDLRQNASGSLVLMHDTTVDRTAGAGETGLVSSFTDAAWASVTVAWPTPPGGVPVAAGVWGPIRDAWPGRILAPEVSTAGAAAALVADVATNPSLTWRLIGQAFNKTNAATLATAGLRTVQLYGAAAPDLAEDVANGTYAIGLDQADADLTQTLVDDAHAAGLKVFVYTVNTVATRDALWAMGVDAVFTDDPSTLAAAQVTGAAAGSITWTGTATGARASSGAAAGAIVWAGIATGILTPPATPPERVVTVRARPVLAVTAVSRVHPVPHRPRTLYVEAVE